MVKVTSKETCLRKEGTGNCLWSKNLLDEDEIANRVSHECLTEFTEKFKRII